MRQRLWTGAALACLALGCAGVPARQENPAFLPEPAGGYEEVWNETVRVVSRHFPVVREQRYNGLIECSAETSGGVLEPWRRDTATFRDRVEASLQTVRRRCYVRLQPLPAGGYAATVEVHKELEHLPQPLFTNFGGNTLLHGLTPIREATLDQNAPASAGWIPKGRDAAAEALIVADLKHSLGSIPRTGSVAVAPAVGERSPVVGPQFIESDVAPAPPAAVGVPIIIPPAMPLPTPTTGR